MKSLIDWLIKRESVRARLIEAGWKPPAPTKQDKKGPTPQDGPGPWRPPK